MGVQSVAFLLSYSTCIIIIVYTILILLHVQMHYCCQDTYSASLQLFERARQLAANGECERELLEGESRKLESAVHMFASSLDERRDLLVQACTFYCNHQMVSVTHTLLLLCSVSAKLACCIHTWVY